MWKVRKKRMGAEVTEGPNEIREDFARVHSQSLKLKKEALSFDNLFDLFLAIPGLDIIFQINQV